MDLMGRAVEGRKDSESRRSPVGGRGVSVDMSTLEGRGRTVEARGNIENSKRRSLVARVAALAWPVLFNYREGSRVVRGTPTIRVLATM